MANPTVNTVVGGLDHAQVRKHLARGAQINRCPVRPALECVPVGIAAAQRLLFDVLGDQLPGLAHRPFAHADVLEQVPTREVRRTRTRIARVPVFTSKIRKRDRSSMARSLNRISSSGCFFEASVVVDHVASSLRCCRERR